MSHFYCLSMIISHKPEHQQRKLATSKNLNCTLCLTKIVVCGNVSVSSVEARSLANLSRLVWLVGGKERIGRSDQLAMVQVHLPGHSTSLLICPGTLHVMQ